MRSTYTYTVLDVSPAAYLEIRQKLDAAGYQHAFHRNSDGDVIDMHGIALRQESVGAAIRCGCGWGVEATAGDGESLEDAKQRADHAWDRHLEEAETPLCRPWRSRPSVDLDRKEGR